MSKNKKAQKAENNTSQNKNTEAEWFGDTKVRPDEKQGLVGDVFKSVADEYDIMNDAMSAGIHRIWKDKFVRTIAPISGEKVLDVAGGTGDIAFKILKRVARNRRDAAADITVCDINPEMLRVGRARAIDRGILSGIHWVEGNAEKLEFDDNSFDIYTISFGLRNVPHIDDALAEAYRVLKPGGRFFCLEFSHLVSKPMQKLYDVYSYNVIPKLGKLLANDSDSYQYLVESIRKFPTQDNLKSRLTAAGFDRAAYKNLSMGIACIHSGYKPKPKS